MARILIYSPPSENMNEVFGILTRYHVFHRLALLMNGPTEKERSIIILLAEEQTLLSRERTMHSYMQTGLAFTSVGIAIIKFLEGFFYSLIGILLMAVGALLIVEAARRYVRFRRAIKELRAREARLGYRVGSIK
jgi:hypothetical protein